MATKWFHINIEIPEGMHLHRAIDYVTEHAASEIARYAASEVLVKLAVLANDMVKAASVGMMDRAVELYLSNITADLMRKADRRDFLCANVPVCHSCGHNQVQLIGDNQPAQWRCRVCHHFFMHEPKSK